MIKTVVLASDVKADIICASVHELGKNDAFQSQMRDYRVEIENTAEMMSYYGFKERKEMPFSFMAIEAKEGALFIKMPLNGVKNVPLRASESVIKQKFQNISQICFDWKTYGLIERMKSVFLHKAQNNSHPPRLKIRIILYRYDKKLNVLLSNRGILNTLEVNNHIESLNLICNTGQDSSMNIDGNIKECMIRVRAQNRGHLEIDGLNTQNLNIEQSGNGSLLLKNTCTDSFNLLLRGWGDTLLYQLKAGKTKILKDNFNCCLLSKSEIGEFKVSGKNGGGEVIVGNSLINRMVTHIQVPIRIRIKGSQIKKIS